MPSSNDLLKEAAGPGKFGSDKMRVLATCAAITTAAFCFLATPASAQWSYYDGYQAQPAYPSQQPPAGYPPYPGNDPSYAPRGAYSRVPADRYGDPAYAQPRTREASLPPEGPNPTLDAEALQSQRTARLVPNPTREPPGTIVVDTASRHLYYIQPDGNAIEYGIGVGREGFAWKGTAQVGRKQEWPRWFPPSDMLKRRPDLPTEMDGGLENPLGARALYLFKGKTDTLFRIHGTNEPDTIGKAVSSGCIRMMNADVMDLYRRVPVGTRVVVL
jgi:lipoprotein-anchoring transpeptidase ErfK/SrfK